MRRVIALAVVAVATIAAGAPASALGRAGRAAASPANMAYSMPEQCVVLPVANRPFIKARGLLAELGCRVRRTVRASTVRKGLVITAVGGERTYAFGHVVTLIVSSGPATAT